MILVRRTSPLGELVSLRQVTNTPDALVVEAALPGIRPEDVEITVEDRTLPAHGSSGDHVAASAGSDTQG